MLTKYIFYPDVVIKSVDFFLNFLYFIEVSGFTSLSNINIFEPVIKHRLGWVWKVKSKLKVKISRY